MNESKGSPLSFDVALIFKTQMSRVINAQSDEQTEYLINDHLPFMIFQRLSATKPLD
ncbi:hypothetical protein ATPR_1027 [Acetobacter tropicalis NBRC 101654]|uniref:Transposase n=1 Tax=Acetobacter tropicalis NBRC 101654 TaxID=749388 RepID=F7VCC8_9PROT|nr:hypothetical protein ATPR_1027 [Acetobacter tropicalis NBRC 101654]